MPSPYRTSLWAPRFLIGPMKGLEQPVPKSHPALTRFGAPVATLAPSLLSGGPAPLWGFLVPLAEQAWASGAGGRGVQGAVIIVKRRV